MNHDNDNLPKDEKTTEEVTSTESTNETEASQEKHSNDVHKNESANNTTIEKTWHNKNAMKRGIAMLGYGFIAGFVRVVITLIAIFQFFSLLFSEKPNQPLVKFGQNLNTYQYQINQFLTVNSEMYPFPFADWPDSAPEDFANSECTSRI